KQRLVVLPVSRSSLLLWCLLPALVFLVAGIPSIVPLLSGLVEGPSGSLAGARVRYKGTMIGTPTDAPGRFTLPWRSRGPVTAWKEGYFIAGSRGGGLLRLKPLPERDHEDYEWIDPTPAAGDSERCGRCHQDMFREWRQSGHSRSATGKHFRNLYDGTDWH